MAYFCKYEPSYVVPRVKHRIGRHEMAVLFGHLLKSFIPHVDITQIVSSYLDVIDQLFYKSIGFDIVFELINKFFRDKVVMIVPEFYSTVCYTRNKIRKRGEVYTNNIRKISFDGSIWRDNFGRSTNILIKTEEYTNDKFKDFIACNLQNVLYFLKYSEKAKKLRETDMLYIDTLINVFDEGKLIAQRRRELAK